MGAPSVPVRAVPFLDDATWREVSLTLGLEPGARRQLAAAWPHGSQPAAPADLVLAHAAVWRLGQALPVFERRCMAPLASVLRRLHGEPGLDDLLQDVRLRLLAGPHPRLLTYRGECPLPAWVRAVGVRVALNALSGHRPRHLEDDALHELAAPVDVTLDVARAQHRERFQAAFREAMARLTPRERALLRLHYLQGVGLERLAQTYGCHRATVVRWLASARDAVFAHTRDRLAAELRLSSPELESLLREAREQLTISLASVDASQAA
jgi:RNA polymerase sigma-70 factor (ECF subfamily)